MPAENSIAAQVNTPKSGLEWSGPSFVRPYRDTATKTTKTRTTVATRK